MRDRIVLSVLSLLIAHWDGSGWTVEPSITTARLNAVWTSAPGEVWVAGQGGLILHREGGVWFPVRAAGGVQPELIGISGAGELVFFVGDQGAVLTLRHSSPWPS